LSGIIERCTRPYRTFPSFVYSVGESSKTKQLRMAIHRGRSVIASKVGWYWQGSRRGSFWPTRKFLQPGSNQMPRTIYALNTCQTLNTYTTKSSGKGRSSNASAKASKSENPPLPPAKGLEQPILKPFTRLDEGTWLHNRPEVDVYKILIDAYRLRVEDTYVFRGELMEDSLYANGKNGLRGFQKFLGEAAAVPGLLPPWWNKKKKAACERLGMDESQWSSLRCAVEKSDIIEHYGDRLFPMQLRMMAEAVYGVHPSGTDAAPMRKLMVSRERGQTRSYTMFDISRLWKSWKS
ncbi:hypothetical protein V8C35DRAFT_328268, partial [Trichoderma chlorosporum]